jgi:putative ABC transport system permease protein
MRFLSLAWRNIQRNRRRTGFTLAAICIGVTALVMGWGMFDGSNAQMIENMTGNYTGYVQIHSEGYTDDPTIERTFDAKKVEGLDPATIPGVTALSPRIEAPSLLSAGENSRGILMVGVNPDLETSVTVLHKKIEEGRYLDNSQPGGIVVGRSLAKALGVGIGGQIDVLTQGMQGSVGAVRYRVHGIYNTGNDMVDGLQAFISLKDAHQLLSSEGRLTTVAIKLADREMTDATVARLRTLMGSQFEVKGWRELLPAVAQSIDFHEAMGHVVMTMLFGIVAIGVANTMLMSVLERRREFGVMLALGTSPWQMFRSILYEGLLIGGTGFLVGSVIGYALVSYFGYVGIDYGNQAKAVQSMQGMTSTNYPQIGLPRLMNIAFTVFAVSVVAALYPAWKTARLVPLKALQGGPGTLFGGASAPSGRAAMARFLLPTLGLRNLGRHPMRTVLTVLAITFGLGAFIFIASFATGYYTQMVDNVTGMSSGHAQVQHKDFKTDLNPALTLHGSAEILGKLRGVPGVAAASSRIQALAMVTSPVRSEAIMLIGVDPAQEETVTILHRAVKAGRYLRSGDDREVVIGKKLAELLHADVGEKVVVMVQDTKGQLASEAFVVAGIFNTGSDSFDKAIAHVTLPSAQRMLSLGGQITGISLRVEDRGKLASVLKDVQSLVGHPDLRVLPWQELMPEVDQMSFIIKRTLLFLLAIVFTMVGVVVVNTVLMSILERVREFGTMLALGSRPGLIVRMVLFEAGLLGLLGAAGGAVLGSLLGWLHSAQGISLKTHGMTAIPGTTDVVFPQLTLPMVVYPAVAMPLTVLLVCLPAALRASRLKPVDAMRHV